MTKDELTERLADVWHQRWGDWHQWQDSQGFSDPYDVAFCFDGDEWSRWNTLADTPYAALPEHSKQADRDQVARYWPLIVEFVAEYMEGLGKTHITKDDAQRIAGCWKQEMS